MYYRSLDLSIFSKTCHITRPSVRVWTKNKSKTQLHHLDILGLIWNSPELVETKNTRFK